MTDQAILEAFASEEQPKIALAFKQLNLTSLPIVKGFVTKHGGSSEDAEEILQETILAFWQLLQRREFTLTTSLTTFLVAICKRLWWKHLRQNRLSTVPLDYFPDDYFPEEGQLVLAQIIQERKHQVVSQVLETMGDDCKEIILETYYRRSSMKELAVARNTTEGYMRNKKYRCLEYLREEVLRRWQELEGKE